MHVPTFNPATIPIPLLLSICCIGAMYCMERDKARSLWDQSRRIVDVMIAQDCLTPGSYPSWVSQVLFYHCWYAAWLGDNQLLEWALGRRGSLATVFLVSPCVDSVCHSKADYSFSKWSDVQRLDVGELDSQ
jgi:hypothetical protein